MNAAADGARKEIGVRVARLVLEIDHLASVLSRELTRSKAAVVRELAQDLTSQAQALRLAINMELEGDGLLGPCEDLKLTAHQLSLVCSKTRIPQGTRLALALVAQLLPQLYRDLQEWTSGPTWTGAVKLP